MIAVLRAGQLVAAALLVGGPLFYMMVWAPSLAALTPERRVALSAPLGAWVRRLLVATAVVLALMAALDLLRLAALFSRAPLYSGDTVGIALELLTGSDVGRLTMLRILAAGVILTARPWALPEGKGPVAWMPRAVSVAAGLVLLITFSLTGHAATTLGNKVGPVMMDLVHLGATAAWFSGICFLALALWGALREEPAVFARFSNFGLAAMIILGVTGLLMAQLRLYGLVALVEHPYGLTLAAKLAFLVGVLLLAGANLFWVKPRLAPGGSDVGHLPHWLISGEVVLGLAVVIMAGILSTTAPPKGEPVRFTVELSDHAITPDALTIPHGEPVRLTAINRGSLPHSYVIREIPHQMESGGHDHGGSLDMQIFVEAGRRATVTFIPLRAGTYEVYCMVAGHAEKGMVGTLTVK